MRKVNLDRMLNVGLLKSSLGIQIIKDPLVAFCLVLSQVICFLFLNTTSFTFHSSHFLLLNQWHQYRTILLRQDFSKKEVYTAILENNCMTTRFFLIIYFILPYFLVLVYIFNRIIFRLYTH